MIDMIGMQIVNGPDQILGNFLDIHKAARQISLSGKS
jgi:hypothetical protein